MNHKNSIWCGFACAAAGIVHALKTQRNMRFHITTTVLVCLFGYFYGLSQAQWVWLACSIVFVLLGEMVNTAIESAVDTATKEYSPYAKAAKDAAAGAVLLAAIFAVITAAFLFLDSAKLFAALKLMMSNWIYIGSFAAVFILGLIWVLSKAEKL